MTRWILLLLVAAIAVVGSFCVVIVDQREIGFRTLLNQADFQLAGVSLNDPVLDDPGPYLRIPFLHQVYRFDGRLLRYQSTPQVAYTADSLPVRVDYYAMWRISDPRRFYEAVRSDLGRARSRIDNTTYGKLRNALGKHGFAALLSDQRSEIVDEITRESDAELAAEGIDIIDLHIRGLDFPEANLEDVYKRMRSERERFGLKARAEGAEKARQIRSKADEESQVILAEAERRATELQGSGDADAAGIYAEAFGQDPEFYAFVRSLEAYRKALDAQTTVILSPEVPFLKYLFESEGLNGGPPAAAPPTP